MNLLFSTVHWAVWSSEEWFVTFEMEQNLHQTFKIPGMFHKSFKKFLKFHFHLKFYLADFKTWKQAELKIANELYCCSCFLDLEKKGRYLESFCSFSLLAASSANFLTFITELFDSTTNSFKHVDGLHLKHLSNKRLEARCLFVQMSLVFQSFKDLFQWKSYFYYIEHVLVAYFL